MIQVYRIEDPLLEAVCEHAQSSQKDLLNVMARDIGVELADVKRFLICFKLLVIWANFAFLYGHRILDEIFDFSRC